MTSLKRDKSIRLLSQPTSVASRIALMTAFPFVVATLAISFLIGKDLANISLDVERQGLEHDIRFYRNNLVWLQEYAENNGRCLPDGVILPAGVGANESAYRFEQPGCAPIGDVKALLNGPGCFDEICIETIHTDGKPRLVALRSVVMGEAGCGLAGTTALPGPAGCLHVWRPLSRHSKRIRSVFYWSLAALSLALLATAYIAMNLGRRITERISAVSHTLKKFAEGDRNAKIMAGRTGDEIEDLGKKVNQTLRRIQQDMAAANRVNGSMSHQLLAPVRRVRNISDALAERLQSLSQEESDRRKSISLLRLSEEADQASIELGHVVRTGEDLQNLLVANRSRTPGELNELVDLYETCSVVAARFRSKAAQRNLTIRVDCELIEVRSSAYIIEQILSNMLDNAIIYGPGESEIVLSSRRDGDNVVLGVQDEGDGPPHSVLKDVFDDHLIVETTYTGRPGAGGHGIGLLTIRQLTESCDMKLRHLRPSSGGWRIEVVWMRSH